MAPPDSRMISSGPVSIHTESFGSPADPPLLLIMGQMASLLWWPTGFCQRLARAGRHVIRYDHRDTGLSTSFTPGEPPYALDDLAADAVAVLDGYELERAHLVGMSMGGAIAQLVALRHPGRVSSLTAISTVALGGPDPDLPGPTDRYNEHAAAGERVDWSDARAIGEFLVADARELASARHPFDEAATRALIDQDIARATSPESIINHAMVGLGEPADMSAIHAPALVIHGSADPLLPPAHGAALADALPDARLVLIAGGGHELHESDWGQIAGAVIDHTEVD